jgi:hypothetical protein
MAIFDDVPGFKCRPHAPHDSALYAIAFAAPRSTRSLKGLPALEPLGSCGTTPNNFNTSIGSVQNDDMPYDRGLRPQAALESSPAKRVSSIGFYVRSRANVGNMTSLTTA